MGGFVMGFGSGVLTSAVAFELTRDAFDRGGTASLAAGLVTVLGFALEFRLSTVQ